MKKWIAIALALLMTLSLASCAMPAAEPETEPTTEATTPPTMAPAPVVNKTIYLLVPEANAQAPTTTIPDGMELVMQTYADAAQQVALVEAIAAQAPHDGSVGVVLAPAGEELAPALASLVQANIAYALAEFVPEGAGAASVANVQYDQMQIGAAMAAYMVEKGATKSDKIMIIQGLSDADDLRTQGFKQYLQGKLAYDGKLIEKSWSSVKNLVYSDMQGTTQESAETYFQTYMDSAEHAATRYIVAWDDTYALGVLEALEGANISESVKKTFLEGKPVMASVGGNEALSQVLSGTNPNYTNIASFEQIRSIQYSQNLLADALTAMCDYFAGQVVEQDQIQPIQWMN